MAQFADGHRLDAVRLSTFKIQQLTLISTRVAHLLVTVGCRGDHFIRSGSEGRAPRDQGAAVVTVRSGRHISHHTGS